MSQRSVFFLDKTRPSETRTGCFLVCMATEGRIGFRETGADRGPGDGRRPWYWDDNRCELENRRLGISPEDAAAIVISSMGSVPG